MTSDNNKFDLYEQFKVSAEERGWLIKEYKEINYGIQFCLVINEKKGIIRIFEGKKGVRFDLSQVKNLELLSLVEGIITNSNKNPDFKEKNNTKKSKYLDDIEVFPDELIGTDESGKGDFFGPLVIAGVYVNKNNLELLRDLGVTDSKKLSDKKIADLATKIKQICPYNIVVIGNKKYNELYEKFNNLNKLLAWGHARAIENLLENNDCQYALSDQFGDKELINKALLSKGKTITLFQRPKAEEIISVAAASIIARNEYVNRLSKLSYKYKLELPKGASTKTIQIAKQFVSLYGKAELENVAKLHFKTIQHLED
ncbi:ribonuclease HIII [Lysinibacillus sp. RC46]|uniref:ribonuclease HIII n=1 Tax=Lysinibacillus sp. RC46 TaxID=3156295 RepID=UPI003518CF38